MDTNHAEMHPREVVLVWLRREGLTQEAGAKRIGICRPTLAKALGFISGTDTFLTRIRQRIEKATGAPAGGWL